jgi:vitellogenic carboxypeptidase-like protein/serine carboxypeptidase-like clade 4
MQVHNAGHMVPMDQPKAALEMLRRFTQGKLKEPVVPEEETSMFYAAM